MTRTRPIAAAIGVLGILGCQTPVNDSYLESVVLELASKRSKIRNMEIPGTPYVAPVVLYRQFDVGGLVLQAVFVNDYSGGSPDPAELCASIARTARDLVCIKR